MKLTITLIIVTCLLVASNGVGLAQGASATVSGQATDQTGAVVPGVQVVLTEINTRMTRTVETNATGIYVVGYLPPGEYELSVTKQGFRPVIRKGIILQVDQEFRQDFHLEIGAAATIVEVVEQSEQALKPITSELGEVIGKESIQEMPLNGRNFLALVTITTGVAPGPPGVFNNLMGGLNFSVGGLRENSSSYMIDGYDNNQHNINVPFTFLQADAIQEFNILTNNYSAEYGRSAGGIVSMVMRSGTNKFHGSLFEFVRNDKFDANDFFTNKVGGKTLPYRYNQFGGTIGGPIIRDKTFFFAAYQGTRNVNSNPFFSTVPTLAERTGDFSGLLASRGIQIFDPTSTTGASTGRTAFPGNIIPLNKQNPAGRALLALYPYSNLPGSFNNYYGTQSHSFPANAIDVKVDHNFSGTDTLSFRYNRGWSSQTNSPLLGENANGGGIYGSGGSTNMAITYAKTFSPSMVNEFRFGWLNSNVSQTPWGWGENLNNQVGIPSINLDQFSTGLAYICFANRSCVGGQAGFPVIANTDSFQFTDSITFIHGRHVIRTGLSVMPRRLDLFQPMYPSGTFFFDALFTSRGGVGGDGFASALTGYSTFGQRDVLNHFMYIRDLEMGAFVQDTFRVTRKLTLNLGLRWDLFTPQVLTNDQQSNFDPATKSMLVAGSGSNSRALVNLDKKDFQPRVGFAYSLTEKTVVRGGYGISYIPERDSVAQNRISYNPPFYYFQVFNQSSLNYPVRSISDGLPALVTPDPTRPSGSIQYQDPNLRNAMVQYWNLNVQRALTSTIVFDIAYAGNHGTHLLTMRNINQPPAGPVQVYPYLGIGYLNTFEGRGNSTNNSLQMRVAKRFSSGLSFRAGYTWAKSIDDSPGFWPVNTGDRYPMNSYDYEAERGRSANDITHRFFVSYNWELPVGKGKAFLNNANPIVTHILGGWQMTGIGYAQSGFPFTPVIAANRANTANGGAQRPNRLATGALSNPTIDRWYDTSAFALPALYTYGNSGRDILNGPRLINFDMGLYKNFKFTERLQLQFRTEAFNLFNRPDFGLPNRTIDSPTAGLITATSHPPRQIQFALKLLF